MINGFCDDDELISVLSKFIKPDIIKIYTEIKEYYKNYNAASHLVSLRDNFCRLHINYQLFSSGLKSINEENENYSALAQYFINTIGKDVFNALVSVAVVHCGSPIPKNGLKTDKEITNALDAQIHDNQEKFLDLKQQLTEV